MNKWEYLHGSPNIKSNVQEYLDSKGEFGWELVSFTCGVDGRLDVFIFKRPLQDTALETKDPKRYEPSLKGY